MKSTIKSGGMKELKFGQNGQQAAGNSFQIVGASKAKTMMIFL